MKPELILAIVVGVLLVILLLRKCGSNEGYAASLINMSSARGYDPIVAPEWSGGIRPRTFSGYKK